MKPTCLLKTSTFCCLIVLILSSNAFAISRLRGKAILYYLDTRNVTAPSQQAVKDYILAMWQEFQAQGAVIDLPLAGPEAEKRVARLEAMRIADKRFVVPVLLDLVEDAASTNMKNTALFLDWTEDYLSTFFLEFRKPEESFKRPAEDLYLAWRDGKSKGLKEAVAAWRAWWFSNKDRPMLLPDGQRRDNILACLKDYFYAKDQKTKMEAAEDLDYLYRECPDLLFLALTTLINHNQGLWIGEKYRAQAVAKGEINPSLARGIHRYLKAVTRGPSSWTDKGGDEQPSRQWIRWWKQSGAQFKWPSHVAHLEKGKKWSDPYDVPASTVPVRQEGR